VTCGDPFQGIDDNSVIIEGYMDPALEGTVLPLVVLLNMFLLDLIPQCVWGMENGNQIQGKWNAKVSNVVVGHSIILTSFT
jgi:hypothetical protein